MRNEVTVSAAEQNAIAAFLAKPLKTPSLGPCCGCNRGIPMNYPARVSSWETATWSSTMPGHATKVQKPKDVWCKECSQNSLGAIPEHNRRSPKRRSEASTTQEENNVLTPKEIAIALLGQLSTTDGHGSKTLAKMAEIDVDKYEPQLIPILRKLEAAGKVEKREKKWWLADA